MIIIIISLLIFLIKISLFKIIGYSFLSLNITSNLTIKIFNLLDWNYESKKALYQHFIIDCLIGNYEMVGTVDEMQIIFNENENIIFNIKSIFKNFFSQVKGIEFFYKSLNKKNKQMSAKYINKHYTIIEESKFYKDKNLSCNYTSSSYITVLNEEKINNKILLKHYENPNFIGENKNNYLTPPYNLNKNSSKIDVFPEKHFNKINTFKKKISIHFINNKNEKLILCKENKFYEIKNPPTIKEYAIDIKTFTAEKIVNLEKFEKINENYLNTEKGKQKYELIKNYFINN